MVSEYCVFGLSNSVFCAGGSGLKSFIASVSALSSSLHASVTGTKQTDLPYYFSTRIFLYNCDGSFKNLLFGELKLWKLQLGIGSYSVIFFCSIRKSLY